MKVGELRDKLEKYSKKELIKIAAEFYKQLPKAKKEALKDVIENPSAKPAPVLKSGLSLTDIKTEAETFILNAKAGNYIKPNQIVPKAERSKWRFLVKRLYKELSKLHRPDKDLPLQAQLLTGMYHILSKAETWSYFNTHEPFNSIGITKAQFLESILFLIELSEGKVAVVEQGINLMYDCNFESYYTYEEIAEVFEQFLTVPDLKYQAIDKTTQLLKHNDFQPIEPDKKAYYYQSAEENRQERINNNLAILGFAMYLSLFEYDEALEFFAQHYYVDDNEEAKLYVLVRLLFKAGLKDQIKQQIIQAQKQGIKPRRQLIALLKVIENDDELPVYF